MGANTNPVNNQAKQAVGSHTADNELESEVDADLRTGGAKQKLSPSQDVEAVLDNADGAAAAEVGPLKHLADAPGNEMDG
jgi:hypothetical protein